MRTLVVHFSGGTEVSIETAVDPQTVYDALAADGEWLVVEDTQGERHYLAIRHVAYLTFSTERRIGFA